MLWESTDHILLAISSEALQIKQFGVKQLKNNLPFSNWANEMLIHLYSFIIQVDLECDGCKDSMIIHRAAKRFDRHIIHGCPISSLTMYMFPVDQIHIKRCNCIKCYSVVLKLWRGEDARDIT